MSYNKWGKNIQKHLEKYKKDKLGIYEKGKWGVKEDGYGHVLPLELGNTNYMDDSIIEYVESNNIKKHSNWYHLNSSQTMCINFFVPLISKNLLGNFIQMITGEEVENCSCEFEKVLEKGSSNFDFYVKSDNAEYFFEIKYTESCIAKKSSCQDENLTYKKLYEGLVKSNTVFNGKVSQNEFMNNHFQAYRNMVMGNKKKNSYCIFITMKSNDYTKNEIDRSLKDLGLNFDKAKDNNIIILWWEDLIDKTKTLSDELENYYKTFESKYIPKKI